MSLKEFEEIKLKFTSEYDPITKKPITLEFGREDFELSEMPLFKKAAFEKLKSLPQNSYEANALSIKH